MHTWFLIEAPLQLPSHQNPGNTADLERDPWWPSGLPIEDAIGRLIAQASGLPLGCTEVKAEDSKALESSFRTRKPWRAMAQVFKKLGREFEGEEQVATRVSAREAQLGGRWVSASKVVAHAGMSYTQIVMTEEAWRSELLRRQVNLCSDS